MAKRFRLVCTAAALVPLTLLAAACGSSSPSSTSKASAPAAANDTGKSISETGSTILFPLFGEWQTAYSTVDPNVTITSGSTGSGIGISDAAEGLVNIGASDAWLSASDLTQYPGLLNIPLTVAAIMVNYNLPGVKKPLNLNGTVLAEIYTGKITTWNDPAIAALNPGVTLPSKKIVTLHRADSAGATFLFASYLNAQDPGLWPSSDVGTTITWPSVPGALAETGNGGMVTGCGSTPDCIAYIGNSYLSKVTAANLSTASLANKAAKYTQPTSSAILAALASFPAAPASGAQGLINTSAPAGYAIVNYEYAIVKKTQPSAAEATVIKAFLSWILTTGDTSTYLSSTNGEPLPPATLSTAKSLVSSISG